MCSQNAEMCDLKSTTILENYVFMREWISDKSQVTIQNITAYHLKSTALSLVASYVYGQQPKSMC